MAAWGVVRYSPTPISRCANRSPKRRRDSEEPGSDVANKKKACTGKKAKEKSPKAAVAAPVAVDEDEEDDIVYDCEKDCGFTHMSALVVVAH